MKFLIFIMALLILALNCIHCADTAFIVKAKSENVTSHATNSEEHNDSCSPFCHCTCCAGFFIDHTKAAISSEISYTSITYQSYLSSGISEIALPIWQPPRL